MTTSIFDRIPGTAFQIRHEATGYVLTFRGVPIGTYSTWTAAWLTAQRGMA